MAKKKKLKEEVYHIIRNDIPLRKKLSEALNIEIASVYSAASRKSTKFSLPSILEIIANHTEISIDEITEKQNI